MYYRLKCYPHGNSKDDIAVLIVTQLLADEGVYVCVHTQTVWVCVDSCTHASACACAFVCVFIYCVLICVTHMHLVYLSVHLSMS